MNQEYFIAKYTPLGIDLKFLVRRAPIADVVLNACVCETVNGVAQDELINFDFLPIDFEGDNQLAGIDENIANDCFVQI